MIWKCIMALFSLVAVSLPGALHAQSDSGGVESLIRLLSPELRRIDKRLAEIERELEPLPSVGERPWGSRYGHRSANLPDETTPDWLQLDLGGPQRVEMVALMPVNLSFQGKKGVGHGFPKRFRLEISDHADMRDALVLVDRSQADVPNPGRYPLVYDMEPVIGRYLRLTSLKHNIHEGEYFWALEELIVMQGSMNLAAGQSDALSYSSSTNLFPQWVPVRVIDGQSTLGMPVDVTTPSPTQGYLSDRLNLVEVGDPLPAHLLKWCAVDLEQAEVIEQVRLLPIESEAFELVGGRGFPRRLQVQFANDPDFNEVIWETQRGGFQLGYPSGCAINISVPDVKARHVRVLVDRLWSRDDWMAFGLSEMQVYGAGRNLALGKRAYASDVADKPPEAGWAPAYLVDGYTSRFRLTEWPEYLRKINLRGQLERERVDLAQRRVARLQLGSKVLGGIGVMVALMVLAGWIWGLVRHQVLRRREAEQLRQQIARDLHDDIGSNLGGIVLLSEIGSQHSPDEESRNDFESIRKAAEEASLSMRDIVWLIQRDPVGLRDMVTKMRQSLRMILNHPNLSMAVEPAEFRDRALGLLFRRHVFLAFKEALNNVRKHSQTDRVAVKVEIEATRLRFTVQDEGVGFDPAVQNSSGCGLNNLKRRAKRVSGSMRIDSAPGKGTKVVFEAPFSS